MQTPDLKLSSQQLQRLREYSHELGIDTQTMITQAVDNYLDVCEEKLARQNDESAQTKFSYDEFWDGVDI